MATPNWSLAPEGATHWNTIIHLWYRRGGTDLGSRAEVLLHTGWRRSAFYDEDLSDPHTFTPRPVPQRKENAMHTITELTPRHLLDQVAVFTERVLEFLAASVQTHGPYTGADFSCSTNSIDIKRWPLYPVRIVLNHAPIDDAQRFADGPMRVSRANSLTEVLLPLVAVNTRGFISRLFTLCVEGRREFCVYARRWQDSIDNLPEFMPGFADTRWGISGQIGDGSMPRFPQLGVANSSVRTYLPGDYIADQFTIGTDEPLWHLREHARLQQGFYDKLPAPVQSHLDPVKVANTYPHLSQKPGNEGMIAFTENGTKGALDRQSVMKAGRFIRRYAYDHVTDEQVKQLAAQIIALSSITYRHSRERADYSRVYQTGPSSCMAYGPNSSRGEFEHTYVDGEFVHPTEVYAHPDNHLELVWGELNGEVISRTIVNTKKNSYTRIYGKENVARSKERLKDYLSNLGYVEANNALDGEPLLLLHPDDYRDAIICPYIDPGNRGVYIEHDRLVVGGPEQADHETGCLFRNSPNRPTWECACCGSNYPEDDERYINEEGDDICEGCLDSHTHAFSITSGEGRYVHESCTVYQLVGPMPNRTLRGYDYIYAGWRSLSDWELVELSSDLYSEPSAAHQDQCVEYESGDYVLRDDLDQFNLFIHPDTDEACHIDDWAVVIDEGGDETVTPRWQVDEGTHTHDSDAESGTCSRLPVYVPITEEDTEEAA